MNPKKAAKCGVCSTPEFERNNYFYGKQFTVRDLLQEQCYLNEKRRVINRMVLGWGVVCGLEVRWDEAKRKFFVEPGMALDCCGHEILICESEPVEFTQYEEQCGCARKDPRHEGKFVLCLEYHECHSEPVELPAIACDEKERNEFNRVRDSFKLRIKPWDEECHKLKPGDIACLNRYKHDSAGLKDPPAITCRTETIHEHLCHKVLKDCPECPCDCVVLATINVKAVPQNQGKGGQDQARDSAQSAYQASEQEHDHSPITLKVDACVDRRFVYNNQLLYDLIKCYHGDLPHIVDFNWRKYVYPKRVIDWDAFVNLMTNGLTVYFDREMDPVSLSPHTFIVTFFHEDTDSGNLFVKRIPARGVRTDHAGDCYTATWLPDQVWSGDELISQKSQLRGGVDVEITLRGSRIWDGRGKSLDGAFLRDKLPTGNGTQGTEFIDWFHVLPGGGKKGKPKVYENF